MDAQEPAVVLLRVAAALLVAMTLTPLVRSVTIGLDATLGQAWPFSLTPRSIDATADRTGLAMPQRQASR